MRCYYPRGGYPCGRCPACLLNKQRAFAFRLEQEQKAASYTVWATFTYSDEFLPISPRGDPCVDRKDCRRLFDNIRKAFPDIKVKHFLCSEYGPKTYRPHYHCLFFCYDSSPRGNHWKNYNDLVEYIQNDAWKRGFVGIRPLNMSVYKYVSKYCCKPELVGYTPTVKPFQMISQGIGLSLLDNVDIASMLERKDFSLSYGPNGSRIELPRYYKQKILPSVTPSMNPDGTFDQEELELHYKAKTYWMEYNSRYSQRNFNAQESERLNHPIKRKNELPYHDYVSSQKRASVDRFVNNLKRRSDL